MKFVIHINIFNLLPKFIEKTYYFIDFQKIFVKKVVYVKNFY